MAGQQISISEDTSWDRVKAAQASKVMTLAPPYLVWLIFGGVGMAFHALFGTGPGAPWSAIGLTLVTVALSLVTWLVSHQRGILGRGSATSTTAAVGMWVTIASVAGVTQPVVGWLWLAGGLGLCAAWNIRTVIREKVGMSGVSDPLAYLFNASKDQAGLAGARMATIEAGERKIEAAMALPAGQKTVGDAQKRTEYIEGAMGLPPGTMTIAADVDRADRALVTFSDPRVLRTPLPYPGPSRPGASIAEPLRPGVWQDADDVEYVIVGGHLQIMGKTGSAKSLGAGWNLLGEIFTRPDAAVLAADLSKGEQTLGPCREGLHRFETTKEGVSKLIRDVYGQIKPRTDYLSSHGFTAWEPGCGLTYWVVWFEEAAKIFSQVSDKDEEMFQEIVKEIRSAGGSVVISLQRADWTQMSTLVRGQLSKMCHGVENSHDAAFGISEAQDQAGCRPELWGSRYPGMAYLDAPSVEEARIAMPLRTFLWDKTGEQMREHCAQWPAATKTLDEFTAAIVGTTATMTAAAGQPGDDQDDEAFDPESVITTPDPDPTITAGLDDPIEDDPDDEPFEFVTQQPKMSPETARGLVLAQLAAWIDEGRQDFTTKDMRPIWEQAGMTRAWCQGFLRKLRADGVIGYDDTEQRNTLLQRPEVAV